MTLRNIAAIDLGASSGRVMLTTYNTQTHTLQLHEIHRFTNTLKRVEQYDCWDLDHLEQQILHGLDLIGQQDIQLHSIGIDTWGVDYVLLNQQGRRVGPSYAYRDHRTDGVMADVQNELGKTALYQLTGIQFLPFNTLYQLKAMVDAKPDWLAQVTDFVMIPDYLAYRLTGKLNREYTNATTSQLVNIETNDWDTTLLDYLNLPRRWFGQIKQPGNQIGCWQNKHGQQIPVISVASHDTASAVLASPLLKPHSAYLCSGTWSLMGIESPQACPTKEALQLNITNEGGVNNHYRVLKNIMGLWLFQRICQENEVNDIASLITESAKQPAFRSIIYANDNRFLNPVSMTDEIKQACKENDYPVPETLAVLTRCIFDSLALLYKQVFNELTQLHHHPLQQLHIVGGGSQNDFLNQLCADLCQVPVTAGPIEASILGNIGCQLMALGDISDIEQFRHQLIQNFPLRQFKPSQNTYSEQVWQDFKYTQNNSSCRKAVNE